MGFSATSTDVECVFSQGRTVLSHIWNCLCVQLTRALLCLGNRSSLGYVNKDITAIIVLPEVVGSEELEEGWDAID